MGLKAHLKKKIFLFTSLKCIIAETYIYIVFTLMEEQILCENKLFKLFILFKNRIKV